jgi:tetratricopeptide (TPR) repeat protein
MLERFGREDDAIKYYEAARRIDPNSTLALKRLADLYKRTGRNDPSQTPTHALAGVTGEIAGR